MVDAESDADGEETERDRVVALSDPDFDSDFDSVSVSDFNSVSESDGSLREDRLDGAAFPVAGVAGGITRIGGFIFVFETTEKSSRYEDRGTKQ